MTLFRNQLLAYADFIHFVDNLPRAAIAGADTAYRFADDAGLSPHYEPPI
jgi:hypothetical protein